MKIDHKSMPLLKVTVLLVVDDYGNEINFADQQGKAYQPFDQAKRFVHGMSFEEMGYLTIYPVHEGH